MAIVTILAYARSRANASLRSAAMQLMRMLYSHVSDLLIVTLMVLLFGKPS